MRPTKHINLSERIADINELFGLRNAMYMRGERRTLFVNDALLTISTHIRKEVTDLRILSKAHASLFARTCAMADSYVNLPIFEALSRKYPPRRCAYCGCGPCECHRNRKTSLVLAEVSNEQRLWTVNDWTQNLDFVYGALNRQRGLDYVQLRLFQEFCEATNVATIEAYDKSLRLTEVRHRIAKEFADMFAWQMTLAAILNVDLDLALNQRYGAIHERCGNRPCTCGDFTNYCFEEKEAATGTVARPS
jgi:NTP pyrophosphatase (non-canonical NTP hydrolase)